MRVAEKEDLPLLSKWDNNPEVTGIHLSPLQRSRTEIERWTESSPFEHKLFIIEKKDGAKIGFISHFCMLHPMGKMLEMGYVLVPGERGKGYGTEAAKIMVDYLFLSKEMACIQATTDIGNVASQKVLEKTGFQREGTMRRRFFIRGEWRDLVLFSILREEWKEPKY